MKSVFREKNDALQTSVEAKSKDHCLYSKHAATQFSEVTAIKGSLLNYQISTVFQDLCRNIRQERFTTAVTTFEIIPTVYTIYIYIYIYI